MISEAIVGRLSQKINDDVEDKEWPAGTKVEVIRQMTQVWFVKMPDGSTVGVPPHSVNSIGIESMDIDRMIAQVAEGADPNKLFGFPLGEGVVYKTPRGEQGVPRPIRNTIASEYGSRQIVVHRFVETDDIPGWLVLVELDGEKITLGIHEDGGLELDYSGWLY